MSLSQAIGETHDGSDDFMTSFDVMREHLVTEWGEKYFLLSSCPAIVGPRLLED